MRLPRVPRSSDRLSDALAVCLDVIALGATVDEALARFPRDAAELRPLLEASIRAREISAPAPSEEARIAARAAVLRAVAAKKAPVTITPHPAVRRRGWLALAPAALAAVVFAAIAVPLVGALDAGALPGDWNYGLKRAGERVQLALTTDPTDRRLLRLEFARRRLGEIEKLSQNGQVDGHASQVVSLVQDYTADITQVQSSVASAPAVDPSTKQAVDKTASDAQTVLQPIAQNATSSAAPVAQSALDAAAQTKQTADDKPSTTPATSPTQVAKATATATATSVQPEPAQALLPSATSAPPAAASATPAETATPTPTTTPAPAPTATPASPTVTATPPLRPAQDLPAVIATPAPSTTVAAATTFPLATGSPEPPAASTATPLPSPTGQPSTVVAAASVTSTPAANATPNATGVAAAASATFAPPSRTPAPAVGDATPAPVGTRPASALTPAPANAPIALQAGDNTVRYSGEPLPLDALLGPILSDVVFVDYADAAGLPHRWYPGTVAPAIGAANPVIIVRLRQPATVTLP